MVLLNKQRAIKSNVTRIPYTHFYDKEIFVAHFMKYVRVTQIHLQRVYSYLCGVFENLSNTKKPKTKLPPQQNFRSN